MAEAKDFAVIGNNVQRRYKVSQDGKIIKSSLTIKNALLIVLDKAFELGMTDDLFSKFRNSTPGSRYYWGGRRLLSTETEIKEKCQGANAPENVKRRYVMGHQFTYNSETYYTHGEIGDWCIPLQGWLNHDLAQMQIRIEADNFTIPKEYQDIAWDDIRKQPAPHVPNVDVGQVPNVPADNGDNANTNDHDGEVGMKNVHNRLVFGAPGTGKSYKLEDERKQDKDFKTNYERVTFYPTYSYAQFVGTYKPVMNGDKIAYRFVPGPFLRLLVKASATPEKKFLLLIEEINRANAAAVFGDVFQLLDRKDGVSEYPVAASEDVKAFLILELDKMNLMSGFGMTKENGVWTGECQLSLPKNFYIWATMNSADQGAFPLDTAFKRRWEFEYVGVDGQDLFKNADDAKRLIRWDVTRKFLNRLLVLHNVNEDKLMGPHFLKADAAGNVPFAVFASKVLMYIWEDAARMCRRQLFGEEIGTYADLVGKWRDVGVKIFAPVMEETGVGGKDKSKVCQNLYKDLTNHDDNAGDEN